MRFLYFILALLILTSCLKQLDAVPDAPEQLVLECYISPADTVVRAVLSRATSFAEKEIKFTDLFVRDAAISISDGVTEKHFVPDTSNRFYQFRVSDDFKIEKGKSYSIKAVAKNGEILTASCTVPPGHIQPEQITVAKLAQNNNSMDVSISWKHNAADQYIVRPYYFSSLPKYFNWHTAHNPQFISGADIAGDILTTNYFTTDLARNQPKNTVFLYVADEHFYAYSKSKNANQNNQVDPFAQPLNAKHNITGGLGCFGAYNVTRIDIGF
ncbi:MAG TPA: DUF4249 domain-containing protein [Dyadobacter sp.]|jgi:hypothetical protein|nr:DUF4249 domain-containing protein [Dyadobacter sp.]